MRTIFNRRNADAGFTLVELMIVVAIIGALSMVAVPNFRKYQAKARSSEAKVQLAAAYTAEQAFFADFNIYHTCLAYMGYDPDPDAPQRYYTIGFTAVQALAPNAHAQAVVAGLNDTLCPLAGTFASSTVNPTSGVATDPATPENQGFFPAGRSIGSVDEGGSFTLVNTTNRVDTAKGGAGAMASGTAFTIGDHSNTDNETFVIGAVGYIDSRAVSESKASVFSINQNKKIFTIQNGY